MPSHSLLRANSQLLQRARVSGEIKHPHARRIKQLQRSVKRNKTKAKVDRHTETRRTAEEAQLFWLATAYRRLTADYNGDENNPFVNAETGGLLPVVAEALVHLFIERNDDEVRALRNPERGHPPRGQIRQLEALKEAEEAQFVSHKGFRVPPFAERADVELTLEWLDALLLLDAEGDAESKKLRLPALPVAHISRQSLKRGEQQGRTRSVVAGAVVSDSFAQLVARLRDQEGIGSHFAEYDDDDDEQEDGGDVDGDADGGAGGNGREQPDAAAKRRTRRRKLFKVKKLSVRATGAKTVASSDVALIGTAKRVQQQDASRDKRRREAMAQARAMHDSDDDEIL